MQQKCSTYITHTDYTVNKCTRLKQSIPRDRYVAMYACNIHMYTTYTAYSSNGNQANTQSVIHVYSWFNHGYNQELFSEQSSFRLPSLTYLMLRRFSSPRTKLLAARCECLHLIKINGLAARCECLHLIKINGLAL